MSRNWQESSPYEHRPGILARTWLSDYERRALRREQVVRRLCQLVVVAAVMSWVALAWWHA